MQVANDILYISASDLKLSKWNLGGLEDPTNEPAVSDAMKALSKNHEISSFVKNLSRSVATFDWRTSSAPGLSEGQSQLRAAYRGSAGYSLLRRKVLKHVATRGPRDVARAAMKVLRIFTKS